jgi:hypothetical protein
LLKESPDEGAIDFDRSEKEKAVIAERRDGNECG